MPAITIVQLLSYLISIGQSAWMLYRAYQKDLAAEEVSRLKAQLEGAYHQLTQAITPQEFKDAAASLAQSHNDILK